MRLAKVFNNGRSRAVRLPKGWIGDADEVEMSRSGDLIVIRPAHATLNSLHRVFKSNPVDLKRMKQSKTKPRQLG